MSSYREEFPVGSLLCIVGLPKLQEFQGNWKFHHPLQPEQLEFAGRVAVVKKLGFYHGGAVLYELNGVPGIWHECCLEKNPR
jgi:hypothetical protein